MNMKKLTRSLALLGLSTHLVGMAQTPPTPQKLDRVEITGSNIKRIADEGALPIEVITADDLAKKGITSVAEMLFELGANAAGADSAVSNNTSFGTDTDRLTGGSASANLRGFGTGSTLVLLNGRRVSTYGMSGGGVDINAIPMAAIARVEVLKDGASAIYGTDAVGGVINFITKSSFEGVSIGASTNRPLAGPAGTTRRAQITGGAGSLDKDGYNIVASLSVDKNDILRGSDRDFSNGFNPALGLAPNSSSSPFANIITGAGSALGTTGSRVGATDPLKYTRINLLGLQGKCDTVNEGVPFSTAIWGNPANPASTRYLCNTDYGSQSMIAAPKEASNIFLRGTLKVSENHQAFAELTGSRVGVKSELTPNQVFPRATAVAASMYPVNGPYYLNLKNYGVLDFDPTKPIAYRWRMDDFGNRVSDNVSTNSRVLVGMNGDVGDYSYKWGLSRAQADAYTDISEGFAWANKLIAALATGIINPWLMPGQKQTPEAMALIESTKSRGQTQHGTTSVTQADASFTGDLMQLPAGPLGFAVGVDLRKETYEFANAASEGGITCTTNWVGPSPASNEVFNCSGNSGVPLVSRNIQAVYGELAVPIAKGLDMQLALRRDKYEGFAATTNPKIAVRYQPVQSFMIRGSVNTGFKAPSFQQQQANNTPSTFLTKWTDGGRCPTDPAYCNSDIDSFSFTNSGNPDLKPETSKQGTVGVVFAPSKDVSFFADYWRVDLADRITKLNVADVINPLYYDLFRDRFERDASGNVTNVRAGWVNASESSTKGLDWGARASFKFDNGKLDANVSGTHMFSHQEATIAGQPLKEYVGAFGARTLYLRDKLTASATWSEGNWRSTMSGTFKSGYADDDLKTFGGTLPAGANTDVDSYTIYSLFTSYRGFKNMTITAGLNNLLDTKPPFSHHDVDVASGAGWDPRVADPYGRTLSVNVKYDF